MRARGTRRPARHRPARAARARRRGRGCARAAPVPPVLARADACSRNGPSGRRRRTAARTGRPHRAVHALGHRARLRGESRERGGGVLGLARGAGFVLVGGDDAVRRRAHDVRAPTGPSQFPAVTSVPGDDWLETVTWDETGFWALDSWDNDFSAQRALRGPPGPRAGGDAGRQRRRLRPGPRGGRGLVRRHRASSSEASAGFLADAVAPGFVTARAAGRGLPGGGHACRGLGQPGLHAGARHGRSGGAGHAAVRLGRRRARPARRPDVHALRTLPAATSRSSSTTGRPARRSRSAGSRSRAGRPTGSLPS